MLVTLLGMVIEVKPVQPLKAKSPILVTLLGMVIDVKFWQLTKAAPAICSIPAGITYAPLKDGGRYANTWSLYTGDFKPVQREKAAYPMLVTLLGMVIEVKPVQSEKAAYPMLVTQLGIVTEVILLH